MAGEEKSSEKVASNNARFSQQKENLETLLSAYLYTNYSETNIQEISLELNNFLSFQIDENCEHINVSYADIQNKLSTFNEKSNSRKKNGVYYTESDITTYIVSNCLKLYSNAEICNLNKTDFKNISKTTVFDPTCGCGAFLLTVLEIKLENLNSNLESKSISAVLKTLYGNDIDEFSVRITKLRLFLCILDKTGISNINGIATILNSNFSCSDIFSLKLNKKFDLVIGNPPYVEESKSNNSVDVHYGNIYANVLAKATEYLNDSGCFGFIVPLSYISTPRMSEIRNLLNLKLHKQIILSFADRPGCLFTSVHQKLNIILGTVKGEKELYTSSYQYWYKTERNKLFNKIHFQKNNFACENFIPKLGSSKDLSIIKKIYKQPEKFEFKYRNGKESLYLNMRACFWIKAFLTPHTTSEYKVIYFENRNERDYAYCLLNSSLFWWFWICVSDCWHITKKEFEFFKFPKNFNPKIVNYLAIQLDNKLEETKKFIGSKQTQYEYKHKFCLNEIHAIDVYINELYGFTENESDYIKNFALSYRTSEGAGK